MYTLVSESNYHRSPGTTWKHEDASEMMLDYLVRDNNIELQPDEVDFIKDLISGNKKHTLSR